MPVTGRDTYYIDGKLQDTLGGFPALPDRSSVEKFKIKSSHSSFEWTYGNESEGHGSYVMSRP